MDSKRSYCGRREGRRGQDLGEGPVQASGVPLHKTEAGKILPMCSFSAFICWFETFEIALRAFVEVRRT